MVLDFTQQEDSMSEDKHSIVDVLSYYGARIPHQGSGWIKIKCCFHDDSHASAAVNIERSMFKCFACDVSGDAYDIIMNREGVKFVEAVKFAERISPKGGGPLQSRPKNGRRVSRKPRSSLGRRAAVLDWGSE